MGEQLILTHENTDFDGLASQLAAWKLYPQAKPVLPRRPNRNLRDFLTLYWDELPFVRYEDLARRADVDRIILVDTQTLVTPRGMSDETQVQIIDHHPLARDLPPNWTYSGEPVGATTTLLLERIVESGIRVTPVEATLLALGIYEDTGSLTYPTTTVRDLRSIAWLAERGANLSVVSDFLHHPLTDQQLELYEALLDSAEIHNIAGHTVVVTTASAEGYVEEISALAHKIRDLYDPAGLFLLAWGSICNWWRARPPTPWTWGTSPTTLAEGGTPGQRQPSFARWTWRRPARRCWTCWSGTSIPW